MTNKSLSYEEIEDIAKCILAQIKIKPKIGIICGSGLGTLADDIKDSVTIKYESLKNFPLSSVEGHKGNFIFGTLGDKHVACLQGRFHPYEGYSTQECTIPIRVMRLLGVEVLITTNASGALNPDYSVGDIVVIRDHLNLPGLAGLSPLTGPNEERFGPRFPALSNAYNEELQNLALEKAGQLNFSSFVRRGVYAMQFGPCYETVTECKAMRTLGGDLAGMSTTHEIIVAHHAGMRCLALSLVTNKCILEFGVQQVANHKEVLETSRQRAEVMKTLVGHIVNAI